MNLTKHDTTTVDIEGQWYKDQLFIALVRKDQGQDLNHFILTLDDTDLEHFISTLIEFQR
jgi:hypothetical protein